MQQTFEIPPLEAPDAPGRLNPELYLNRELSWIAFNRRVLEEAEHARNPLLERVKFAAIFHSNLDEFFMVRVSAFKEWLANGDNRRTPNGFTPALAAAGVAVCSYGELSAEQQAALNEQFIHDVFPVLTPLAVDLSHPFPFISNLSLSLAVLLDDPANGHRFARVKVPEVLPRLLPVLADQPGAPQAPQTFVWLEELIAANLHTLFPGKTVREAYAMRITRDLDLDVTDDDADDLLELMEENVRQRRFGQVVRLELDPAASPLIRDLLVRNLGITPDDVYEPHGPLGLSALMELAEPEGYARLFVDEGPAMVPLLEAQASRSA